MNLIFHAAFLLAALICFIVAAVKAEKLHWGWTGLAVLVCYAFLSKAL